MAKSHSFYGWVVFHCIYVLHLYLLTFYWWTLVLFHILAILNNAAMNTGCIIVLNWCFCFFFPDMFPGVELLDYMAVLFLVFWEACTLFSTVVALIHIPRTVWESSLLSISSPLCYINNYSLLCIISYWSLSPKESNPLYSPCSGQILFVFIDWSPD